MSRDRLSSVVLVGLLTAAIVLGVAFGIVLLAGGQ